MFAVMEANGEISSPDTNDAGVKSVNNSKSMNTFYKVAIPNSIFTLVVYRK